MRHSAESFTHKEEGYCVQDVRLMYDRLREHVSRLVPLTDDEFPACASLMIPKRVRKGGYLVQEGEVCKYLAFVTRGCLRSFAIDKKGEEHVVQFALEGWWITDLYSFLTGKPAEHFVDALEETDVLLIDALSYEKLCTSIPQFERYFRILLQNNYIATHRRVLSSISLTAEEQYGRLLEEYPMIVQRVAQRHIASYLGITPEALSRIRGRMAKGTKT
jgi:CRP-like cAMP-binding protein